MKGKESVDAVNKPCVNQQLSEEIVNQMFSVEEREWLDKTNLPCVDRMYDVHFNESALRNLYEVKPILKQELGLKREEYMVGGSLAMFAQGVNPDRYVSDIDLIVIPTAYYRAQELVKESLIFGYDEGPYRDAYEVRLAGMPETPFHMLRCPQDMQDLVCTCEFVPLQAIAKMKLSQGYRRIKDIRDVKLILNALKTWNIDDGFGKKA